MKWIILSPKGLNTEYCMASLDLSLQLNCIGKTNQFEVTGAIETSWKTTFEVVLDT